MGLGSIGGSSWSYNSPSLRDGWSSVNTKSDYDYQQQREQSAYDFLRTGKLSALLGGTRCASSSDCGLGFQCSGGQCVQYQGYTGGGDGGGTGGSSGFDGGCSGTGSNSDNRDAGCVSSSSNTSFGCTTPTCGDSNGNGSYDSDCCGIRTCRFTGSATGLIVQCWCGEAPEDDGSKKCNEWCTSYYKSTGELGPGCAFNTCDECSSCNDGTCEKQESNVPCHCNGADECDYCLPDGSYKNGECLECCEIKNYRCGCYDKQGNEINVAAKVCDNPNANGLSVCNRAQNAAAEECAKVCARSDEDNDFGCATLCYPAPNYTEPGEIDELYSGREEDTPEGTYYRFTGAITANGETTYIGEYCSLEKVGPDCNKCPCDSDNSCGECEYCNEECKCVPREQDCCKEEDRCVRIRWATQVKQTYGGVSFGLGCNGPNGTVLGSGIPCYRECFREPESPPSGGPPGALIVKQSEVGNYQWKQIGTTSGIDINNFSCCHNIKSPIWCFARGDDCIGGGFDVHATNSYSRDFGTGVSSEICRVTEKWINIEFLDCDAGCNND